MNASASRWCAVLYIVALVPLTACELGNPLTDPSLGALGAAGPSLTFTGAGSLTFGRSGHTATRLGDGRVLVAGGINGTRLASAELFNPMSGTWTGAPSMAFARHGHVAVALADSRVLVVGGVSAATCANQPVSMAAEIFDGTGGLSGAWSSAGNMSTGRSAPAAVRLADGRVLVAGGGDRCGAIYASAELYDPATNTWSATGSMNVARQAAGAVLLADGSVLVAGGFGVGPSFASLASAELYSPASGTWTSVGSMTVPRLWTDEDVAAGGALALLPDGRVLTAGGVNRSNRVGTFPSLNSAEVFNPVDRMWSATGSMGAPRTRHRLASLGDGRLLVMGGRSGTSVLGSGEAYDPPTGQFTNVGTLLMARFDHSATELPNGSVLITAGLSAGGLLTSAEIFAVNRAPSADAGPEVSGLEGAAVQFDASGSSDPDGQPLTFAWDFGDGTVDSSGPRPSHVYADDGTYQVTVTVSDGALFATVGTVAQIANVAPSVAALVGATLEAGQTYQAAGSFSDPGADVWSATVDYGDGSGLQPLALSGQSFTLSHPFASPGAFTVRVVVSDDEGGMGVAEAQVVVTEPPVVTPPAQIAALIALVGECVARGELSARWAPLLTELLRAAQLELEGGRDHKATRRLRTFVVAVRVLKRFDLVSAACAEELIQRAEAIIAVVDDDDDDDDDGHDDVNIVP